MSTIKSFEDLQELGASSIHERTHITRAKLEQLLHKSFSELNRVQFMGFVSILEREYGVDLSALRHEFEEYADLHGDEDVSKPSVVLQASSNSRKWWVFGSVIAIILLMVIGSMTQRELSVAPKDEIMTLESAGIEADINASDMNTSEANTTIESNVTEEKVIPLLEDQNKSVSDDSSAQALSIKNVLSIKPASKVWVGKMDLETGEKTQKVTKDPIVIDTAKNWLFIFGHGRLDIVTSEGKITIKERNRVWFSYENGLLKQLTSEQFNDKNKGSGW